MIVVFLALKINVNNYILYVVYLIISCIFAKHKTDRYDSRYIEVNEIQYVC